MRFVDLSHTIEAEMPLYPGTPGVQIKTLHTLEKDGFREKQLVYTTHTGTHVDAPAHMLAQGATIDRLPLSSFFGKACVVDVRSLKGSTIDLAFLRAQSLENDPDFVLFYTGFAAYWGKEGYFTDYPVLSEEAAKYLVDLGLKGIGLDAISPDVIDSEDFPIHHILLSAGLIIVENLTNLNQILDQTFTLAVFPLKVEQADGMPVRAVAIVQ